MRITNRMMTTKYMASLNANLLRMTNLQNMLSTGKRVTKPSDDPVSIIDSLRLRTRIMEAEKYQVNIKAGTSWMDTADSSMTQITEVMNRVRELALYGANGTMSDEARRAVAAEVRQMLEQVQTMANTAYGNKYIYSGTNYTEKAYDNRRWYGNDASVNLEIGVGINITVNSQMRSFFMGNNYYDVYTDRVPEGQFTAKMTTTPSTRIDNNDPNTWRLLTPSAAAVFNGLDPNSVVSSTLPAASAYHNVGARIKMEVAGIDYSSSGSILDVKVNISYRHHDSISGESYEEMAQVVLTDAGGGIFSTADAVSLKGGQVVIGGAANSIAVDTSAAGFSVGAVLMMENTPLDTDSNPVNLGALSKVESEYQQNKSSGTGLVIDNSTANNLVAGAAYNNYNASFEFEVTQIDTASSRVQVKVRAHLVDKFSGEHTCYDNLETVWLDAGGADNVVDLYEKVIKPAYQGVENLQIAEGKSEYDYYDFKSRYQFSQLKLEDISRFTVGDRFVVQVTPPVNETASGDQLVTVGGPDGLVSDREKQWVFSKSALQSAGSIGLYTFYMDEAGNIKNSSLDIPTAALQESPEIINWTTNSTFMTGIAADGLPGNYRYQINTATGLTAAVAGLEQEAAYIQKPGVTQLTNGTEMVQPDLNYNGEVMLEVVDKAGNEVTFKVTAHQVSKYGAHSVYTASATLTADGSTSENITIGGIAINNLQLVDAAQITVGDRMVYHITAAAADGDQQVELSATHTSDATLDFSRSWVLSSGAQFPINMDMSFFNLDTTSGKWNNAGLVLSMRGLGNGETASFETGINFDTRNVGVFQIFRALAADLERVVSTSTSGSADDLSSSIFQAITGHVTEIDAKISYLLNEQSRVGARVNRMDMQKNRLEEATITYNELLSNAEDADLAQVIMELTTQENVYKAALATGARIIQPTLVDFLG